jgi:hypothetical protein
LANEHVPVEETTNIHESQVRPKAVQLFCGEPRQREWRGALVQRVSDARNDDEWLQRKIAPWWFPGAFILHASWPGSARRTGKSCPPRERSWGSTSCSVCFVNDATTTQQCSYVKASDLLRLRLCSISGSWIIIGCYVTLARAINP